jgi:hypothetical protein
MPIDPIHQAAFQVQASPKLFLCLLGSGVSRAAGVPTGYEIAVDLLRRIASARGEKVVGDPESWCEEHLGYELDYSRLVEAAAPASEQQSQRLREYFLDRDPIDGRGMLKPPTKAHRSIAAMVRGGQLRTVVTTNFDRLIEKALEDAGVPPRNVFANDTEFERHRPFHACDHFVVKLHGDWASGSVRNTDADLNTYTHGMNRLLDRLLDEHGLIVCGWSATYDGALRAALERRTARHPCYWVDPGELSAAAEALRAHLGALHIRVPADEFFEQLEIAVQAIDAHQPPEHLDAQIVVARAKRLITEGREVELDDLVDTVARGACHWLENPATFRPENNAEAFQRNDGLRESSIRQLDQTRQVLSPLLWLAVTLARYSEEAQRIRRAVSFLLRSAEYRLEQLQEDDRGDKRILLYHPAHMVAYAFGVGCVIREHWRRAVEPLRAAAEAVRWRLPIGDKSDIGQLVRRTEHPQRAYSDRMRNDLLEPLASWVPDEAERNWAFDRFEYLLRAISEDSRNRSATNHWLPGAAFQRTSYEQRAALAERLDEWKRFWTRALNERGSARTTELSEAVFGQQSGGPLRTQIEVVEQFISRSPRG